MNPSTIEIPIDYEEFETRVIEVLDEPLDAPRLAATKVPVERKTLDNYESKMRSYAERCLAGR